MSQFDYRDDLVKSGLRRLRDAEELLQEPSLLPKESGADNRHASGARYLAGYTVECLVKAYVIAQERDVRRLSQARDLINTRRLRQGGNAIRDICASAVGHDIAYLLSLTDLEARLDARRRAEFDLCSRWRSVWRYDSRFVSAEDARMFVGAARSLTDWLLPQV